MALKWIIGDFRNGAISEANELPVVYNDGDKVEIDVNANESATITVSKNDLPSDWRTYLRPVDRFVALIEADLAWASSVIWAGFINKASARVNETVQIQATGLREYMAARIVSNTYNTTNTNPETAVVFTSSAHRGLMANMILACFSSSGIPSSSPKPPQVLSSVTGSASGTTVSHSVLLSDFETYGNMLDEWRDELSDNGQEYRFTPSWSSSSKTAIRWIGEVATPTVPHFNEDSTLNIVLGDNEWKPISYGQSASSDNMVSRIIGQSKEGEKKAGADYTTKTTTSSTSILLDESWNPGVELTTAQMTSNLTARLNYNSQTFKEADFSRAYETTAELRTIISQLGSMATFSGSGASQYFGLTMRIVGVSFNPSKKTVELQLAPKAARYPKLPKDNRGLKKKSETKNTGRKKKGTYGEYNNPIVSQPKPGTNGSDIPGGNYGSGIRPSEPTTPPPFTNPKDSYTDAESVIQNSDYRLFKPAGVLATENSDSNPKNYFHPYPHPHNSRFNYNTGEYVGLNTVHQTVYTTTVYRTSVSQKDQYPVHVYAMDIPGMFNSDSNPYKNTPQNNATPYANDDANLRRIGTIDPSQYADLIIPGVDYLNSLPAVSTYNSSADIPPRGVFEYFFWTSEDFSEVYVHVMFGVYCWINVSQIGNKFKLYSQSRTRLFKGTRNGSGVITSWENLGRAMAKNPMTETESIYTSNNIYEVNGNFIAMSGSFIPSVIDAEDRDTSQSLDKVYPKYDMKFVDNSFYKIDYNNNWNDKVNYDLDSGNTEMNPNWSGNNAAQLYSKWNIPLSIDYNNNTKEIIVGTTYNASKVSQYYSGKLSGNNIELKTIFNSNRYRVWQFAQSSRLLSSKLIITYNALNFNTVDIQRMLHDNNCPVLYKDNYIQLSPVGGVEQILGTASDGESRINKWLPNTGQNYTEEFVFNNNIDKRISYLRSKKGYDDVVSGELKLKAKDITVNYFPTSTIDYNINIFNGITIKSGNRSMFDTSVYKQGWKSISYNGNLYIISDMSYPEITDDLPLDQHQKRFDYWVGKFSFKDNLL